MKILLISANEVRHKYLRKKISQFKNPKNKYIIGKNAFLANMAKRVMGDHYSNLFLKKFFKVEN